MTRQEKLNQYFSEHQSIWCNTKGMCGCRGCVNRIPGYWNEMFPGEPNISEQEVIDYNNSDKPKVKGYAVYYDTNKTP